MSCCFDKDIIHKYIDNTIDPLELIFMKEHIANCQECKDELELLTKIDDSLYDYFGNMPSVDFLDDLSLKTLEGCYQESKVSVLKQSIESTVNINKNIFSNATRYIEFLPGSKFASSCAKKAGKGLYKAASNALQYSVKRLLTNTTK